MNRRTVLKGGLVLAATSHAVALAPSVGTTAPHCTDFMTSKEKDAYIIGAYVVMTYEERAEFREMLRGADCSELAEAFDRMPALPAGKGLRIKV